jgi:hypothetical protein
VSTTTENHFYSGRVTELKRLRGSQNGNPRWRINLDDGTTFSTEPDAVVGFAISETEHSNHWVKLELNGNDRIVGVEVLGRATEVQIAPQKLTEAQKLTQEITLLWDHRTNLGEVFLNNQDDREEMRALLATHETPFLNGIIQAQLVLAFEEAAEAFPSDIPGASLVREWLEERANQYQSGELDAL